METAAEGEREKSPAAEMVTISWKWREVGRGVGVQGRLSGPGKIRLAKGEGVPWPAGFELGRGRTTRGKGPGQSWEGQVQEVGLDATRGRGAPGWGGALQGVVGAREWHTQPAGLAKTNDLAVSLDRPAKIGIWL